MSGACPECRGGGRDGGGFPCFPCNGTGESLGVDHAPAAGVMAAEPTDDQLLDLAASLGLPYEVLPDSYCEGVGLPPGSRAYGDVTKEQLLAFARAIRALGTKESAC